VPETVSKDKDSLNSGMIVFAVQQSYQRDGHLDED
jgi:hypothetical protein